MVDSNSYEMCFLKKISEPDMSFGFNVSTRWEVKNSNGEVMRTSRRVVHGSQGVDEDLVEMVYKELIKNLKFNGWELNDDILSDDSIILRRKITSKINLETPCRVSITRLPSTKGMYGVVRAFLNGTEVGILKNGETRLSDKY